MVGNALVADISCGPTTRWYLMLTLMYTTICV